MEKNINYEDSKSVLTMIVQNGELPSHIYKYTDAESLKKILINSTLKFSNPKDFNDPFDCNITIDSNNSPEEIEEYLRKLKKEKNLSDIVIEEKRIEFSNPIRFSKKLTESINLAKERLAVTCFSKIKDNLLMWAHYSDKHKGACLKFEILEDPDFFMTPFHVLYNEKYPSYNYLKNREGLGKFLLENKSIDWEYEKEIRLMKETPDFYKFNKSSLVELIFGARMPEEERTEITRLLTENGYDRVKIKVSKISQSDFKLEFENYE